MKQFVVTLAVLGCFAIGMNAQQQNVISPAGSSYVGSLGYISYTIGEPIIGTSPMNGDRTVVHGFENPKSQFKAFNDAFENDDIHFSGVVMDNGNYMKWTISQVVEDAQYELMRSKDGASFETVAFFSDTGNDPNNILTFTYLDMTAPTGLSYYVLNRIDVDGDSKNSDLITLFRETYSLTDNFEFQIFPNPVVDVLNIHLEKGDAEFVTVNIIEVTSRLLDNIKIDLSAGQSKLDLSGLRTGVYVLSIFDPQGNLIGLKRIRKAD